MSSKLQAVNLSPVQVAILVESLGVCLDSDTFLDDPITQQEAEHLMLKLELLP